MAPLHEDAVLAGAEAELLRDGRRRPRVPEEEELDLARVAVPREHFGEGVELAELVLDRAAPHERALALAREHEAFPLQLVQRLPDGDATYFEAPAQLALRRQRFARLHPAAADVVAERREHL